MPRIDTRKVAEILKKNDLDAATLRKIVEEMDRALNPEGEAGEASPQGHYEADLKDRNLDLIHSEIRAKDRLERRQRLVGAVGVSIAAAAAAATLFTLIVNPKNEKTIPEQFNQTSKILASHQSEIDALKVSLSDVVKAATAKPPLTSQDALVEEQSRNSLALQKLDSRLISLEAEILETPDKALSLPLIRKDISDLERQMEEYRTIEKSEIDRIHDEQKWSLEIITAVILAILAGSIKIVLTSLPKQPKEDV